MKILYTAPFATAYIDRMRDACGEIITGPPEADGLLSALKMQALLDRHQPDVLIVELNPVPGEVIASATGPQALAVCRSGTNNIDVVEATAQGIPIINAPGRNAVAVAEFAIASMVSIARNLVAGATQVQRGEWQDALDTWYALEGLELAGRKAGIVGLGAVGRAIAQRLKAFDMTLFAYDPFISAEVLDRYGITSVTLDALMETSDFIVLAAAVTPKSRGMINARRLELMKPNAYLINVARAALVDMDALWQRLHVHQIGGAVLDVHETEPLPQNSRWLTLDNALLTPHIGGATKDVTVKHSHMIYEDLCRLNTYQKPKHLVNPQVWERFDPSW